MVALGFAMASAILMLPREYHIDCSGWNGGAVVEFKVRITAMDGTVKTGAIELQPGSTPEAARNALWDLLESTGHRGRTVGKGIIVLEGAKMSAVRAIEFTSKDWTPDVRVVFQVPRK